MPILRGRSAAIYQRLTWEAPLFLGIPALALVLCGFATVAGLAHGSTSDLWRFPSLFTLIALVPIGVVPFVSLTLMQLRLNKEHIAGYTTLLEDANELPMVASGSGVVIRDSGAPFLTTSDYRQKVAEIRDAGARVDVSVEGAKPVLVALSAISPAAIFLVIALTESRWLRESPLHGLGLASILLVGLVLVFVVSNRHLGDRR
jgi:hypothetical protein